MSDPWTLLIDDEGPTSISSDEPEARTLLIKEAAASRERTWRSPPSLQKIASQQWRLLLGILAGAVVGFFAALGLRADGPQHDVSPGVYPVRCGDPDASLNPKPQAVDSSASRLGNESGDDSFDEDLMARRAADLVVANRYGEALAIYRRLAERRPEEVAFLRISSVLEAKLRCDSSLSPGGGACD